MVFCNWTDVLKHNAAGAIIGIAGLSMAAILVWASIKSRTRNVRQLALFGVACGLISSVIAYHSIRPAIICDMLESRVANSTISHVRIFRIVKEWEPPIGPPITYSDKNGIAAFFDVTHRAWFYNRDHESYRDGFHIEVFDVADATAPIVSIDVFTKSESNHGILRDLSVVIPRLSSDGASFGEFSHGDLVRWCHDQLMLDVPMK